MNRNFIFKEKAYASYYRARTRKLPNLFRELLRLLALLLKTASALSFSRPTLRFLHVSITILCVLQSHYRNYRCHPTLFACLLRSTVHPAVRLVRTSHFSVAPGFPSPLRPSHGAPRTPLRPSTRALPSQAAVALLLLHTPPGVLIF